jgi:hypothetical protein
MRKHILAVMAAILVLALATIAMAEDPMVGTWKLNVEKSKFSQAYLAFTKQAAPKEETRVFRIVNDHYEFSGTITRTDGSSRSFKCLIPKQGGALECEGPAREGFSLIFTVIGPGNWYATVLQNGKQTSAGPFAVSKDGKTLRDIDRGIDPQGKPFEQIQVFDKQ